MFALRIVRSLVLAATVIAAPGAIAAGDLSATIEPTEPLREWSAIIVHHSATDAGSVESIHRHHRDVNGWDGIGYHFVIGNGRGMGDGEVAATFRWNEQRDGAHAGVRAFNRYGIGVCLIGHLGQAPPTAKQMASFRQLVAELNEMVDLIEPRPIPHGRLKRTACPGPFFPSSELLPSSEALPPIEVVRSHEPLLATRPLIRSCDDAPVLATQPADASFPSPAPRMDPQ